MDNLDLIIIALAAYISRSHLYTLILENDGSRSILDFEHNTNLTLRSLLKDDAMFVRIVERIVSINDFDH